MKTKKSLPLLLLLFTLLCPRLTARDKDIVEKSFPMLTRVTDFSQMSEDKVYALIAHDGVNIYAAKSETSGSNIPIENVTTNRKLFDDDNLFKFNIGSKSKKNFEYVRGKNKEYYLDKSGKMVSSTKGYYWYFRNLSGDAKAFYGDAALLSDENEYRFLVRNEGTTPVFTMLTTYAYQLSSSNLYYPALIYEYDSSIKPLGTIIIGTAEGYGTIYSESAYTMPYGLTGYTITGADKGTSTLTLNALYPAGSTVPAGTALLVEGAKGSYPYYAAEQATDASAKPAALRADTHEENMLHGTSADAMTTAPDDAGSYYFYKLYYAKLDGGTKQLGFFWGAADGGAFKNSAGKAYLALRQESYSQAQGFVLPDNGLTAIRPIFAEDAAGAGTKGIFTLTGVKVSEENVSRLPAGIYIVNGQKTIIK